MRELWRALDVFKDAEPVGAIKRSLAQLPEGDALDNRCSVVISADGPSSRRSGDSVIHRQARSDQPCPLRPPLPWAAQPPR